MNGGYSLFKQESQSLNCKRSKKDNTLHYSCTFTSDHKMEIVYIYCRPLFSSVAGNVLDQKTHTTEFILLFYIVLPKGPWQSLMPLCYVPVARWGKMFSSERQWTPPSSCRSSKSKQIWLDGSEWAKGCCCCSVFCDERRKQVFLSKTVVSGWISGSQMSKQCLFTRWENITARAQVFSIQVCVVRLFMWWIRSFILALIYGLSFTTMLICARDSLFSLYLQLVLLKFQSESEFHFKNDD